MLYPDLLRVRLHEFAYEPRIPELGGDTQVLAAAHESIRLAALGRCGDTVFIEIMHFTTCLANKSVGQEQSARCSLSSSLIFPHQGKNINSRSTTGYAVQSCAECYCSVAMRRVLSSSETRTNCSHHEK